LKGDTINEAVEHCGVRYGVSYPGLTVPPEQQLTVDAVLIPEVFTQSKDKEEKELEREEEKQSINAEREKASVRTTQQESRSTQQQTKATTRKK
jgi:hypothetical protein